MIRFRVRRSIRAHPWELLALALAVGALVVVTIVWIVDRRIDGDSTALVAGTHRAITCVQQGTWTGCGDQVVHFPLLQYLVAAPAIGLGGDDSTVLVVLSFVNVFALSCSFVALIVVGHRTAGRPGAWLLLVVVVTSPLLVYGAHTFREGLAAAILAGLMLVVVSRGPGPAVFVLAMLAGLSQETAAPFVGLLGLLAARDRSSTRVLPAPARWVPLAGGLVVAIMLNALFNQFRYGSFRNVQLLDSNYTVPRMSWRAVLGVSLWLAPNGGVAWFWLGAAFIVLAVVARGVVVGVGNPRDATRWAPNLVLGGVLALHTAGLASWWVPWGWIAWGPRLSLPVLFGATVVAFHLESPWLARMVAWLLATTIRSVAVVAVVVAFTLPHVGALADEAPYVSAMFETPHGACPPVTPLAVFPGVDAAFYRCELIDRAWRRPPVLVERGLAALRPPAVLLAALLVALLVAATRAVRRAATVAPDREGDPVRSPRRSTDAGEHSRHARRRAEH